ncbi:unnamed protein product (macronuclear) [Paramecium tetraurelia]|uniref:Lsm14-like N-terminal domain-containing protein n=1 Tax=Paramecium tetraurelia TaxID=5888 RepID=A0D8H7_PARTE|nr:uncharacterized protein GSPATT00014290001 [Paramecium tetraurelia]CAK79344.1 unnamed protein product [Paramecium tetraurelia]|eukprot:XP_001446741.1 hypothetical protein (macronuclear) [Paramecium tetraurelia strain d4-2]
MTINIETPNHTRYNGLLHKIDTTENTILLHSVVNYGKAHRPIKQIISDTEKHNYYVQFPLDYVKTETVITTNDGKSYKAKLRKIDLQTKFPILQDIRLMCKQCEERERKPFDFKSHRVISIDKKQQIKMKQSLHNQNKSVDLKSSYPPCITNNYRQMAKFKELTEQIGYRPKLKSKN